MRVTSVLLLLAFLAGGCTARLPLEPATPRARQRTSPRSTTVPVSKEHFTRTLKRLSHTDTCFLRCALEPNAEREEFEEERKRHELGVFVGYTLERGEGGATLGIDYAYWVTERFGVGPFIDFVLGDVNALATGAGIWFRPFRHVQDLSFQVAPGVQFVHEAHEAEHGDEPEEGGGKSWEVEPILRLGVTYAFEPLEGLRIAPSFYLDLVYPDSKAFVLGLAIAKEF